MADYILTMLDTTGIQHYIFNTNRLQENIGASDLVYGAISLCAFAMLNNPGFPIINNGHKKFKGDVR